MKTKTIDDIKKALDILSVLSELDLQEFKLKLKPPFKNVNFNIMEKLHEDFKKCCEDNDESQRRVIHKLLIQYINESKE